MDSSVHDHSEGCDGVVDWVRIDLSSTRSWPAAEEEAVFLSCLAFHHRCVTFQRWANERTGKDTGGNSSLLGVKITAKGLTSVTIIYYIRNTT